MINKDKHYEELINQVRERKVTPPDHLKQQFLKNVTTDKIWYLPVRKWAVAATVLLAVGLSWIAYMDTQEDITSFPPGIVIEQFEKDRKYTDPHLRVDDNFYRLRKSYEKLNL